MPQIGSGNLSRALPGTASHQRDQKKQEGSLVDNELLLEQVQKLVKRGDVSIRKANEPVQCCVWERPHEQLAVHSVRPSWDHHLGVEGRDVGLRVLNTTEGDFWNHETRRYYRIHDCLGKRHGASPNSNGWVWLIIGALPHALQVSAQFLIGMEQFFIVCLRRG